MNIDPYRVLGLSKTATDRDIKKAYRKLAMKYHPDRNSNGEEKFKEINAANDLIGTPEKRKKYDTYGHMSQRRPGQAWSQPRSSQNFSEIFSNLMSNNSHSERMWEHLFRSQGSSKKDNFKHQATVNLTAKLTFEEVIFGKKLKIYEGKRVIEVTIPPGAENGQKLRIRDSNGVNIIVHLFAPARKENCLRQGKKDLLLRVQISLKDIKNGSVAVKTPHGEVSAKVPKNIKKGSKIRLKGLGIAFKKEAPGDLYLQMDIISDKSGSS